MITMQDACNPDAARQTFQIENEMAAVPEPFNALRRSLPPDPAAVGAPPKGLSDDGGRDEFAEFRARRSESSTVIVCNRQRSSTRAVGSRASKNARFIAERSTGGLFDMPASESDSRRWR